MHDELAALALDIAIDDMGVYPLSYSDGSETIERTEWQDGWNAAVREIERKRDVVESWSALLSTQQQGQIRELLKGSALALTVDEEGVQMLLKVSDTFNPASADVERMELSDLDTVYWLFCEHGHDGIIAWVANRRGVAPLDKYRTTEYRKAMLKARSV